MNLGTLISLLLLYFLTFTMESAMEENLCRDYTSEHTLQIMEEFLNDAQGEIHIQGGYHGLTIENVTRLKWPDHEELCLELAQLNYYSDSDLDIEVSYFKSTNRYFLVTFFKDTLPSDDGLTFNIGPSADILVLDQNFERVHPGVFY